MNFLKTLFAAIIVILVGLYILGLVGGDDDSSTEIAVTATTEVEEKGAQTTTKPSTSSTSDTFWVTSDRLNRRTCPATLCGVVGKFFHREGVKIFEKRDGWARVTKYYDAYCINGKSEYVDSGRATCSPSNGITNGKFAEWVSLQFLAAKRPADPSAGAKGTAKLIGSSDDFRKYEAVFVKATDELMASGRCTRKNVERMGGWFKSTNFPNKPVYFAYCGDDRLYLDASNGRVFQ